MNRKFVAGLSAFAVMSGAGVAFASTAHAAAGCSTLQGKLHATASRINNGNGTSKIYVSAVQSYREDVPFAPDITWNFRSTAVSGLSTKYTNPASWSPVNFNTRTVTVTWGAHSHGTKSCSTSLSS